MKPRKIHQPLKCVLTSALLSLSLTSMTYAEDNTESNKLSMAETGNGQESANTFDYEFIDVAENLVIIKADSASGETAACGFVVLMKNKPYLITSQRFILGTGRLSFTSLSGRDIKPRSIELSADSDLVRLALADGSGLQINNTFTMNDPVAVFGSTNLQDGTNSLFGTVNGVGGDIFEISAEFEKDNSGAPVMNADREVMGVVSYAVESNSHIMKTGTRFENSKRRFCLRLTGADFKPVNWKKYNQKIGMAYRKNEIFIEDIISVLNSWSEGPLDRVIFESKSGKKLAGWMDSHNSVVSRTVGTGSARRDFYNGYSESTGKLSALCRTHARELYMLAEQRGLSDFMINELEMQASTLNYVAEVIDRYGASTYRTDD